MYYKLKKGVLREITEKAIKKAGTFRKLAKEMNFSKTTVYKYKNEIMNINEKNLARLEQFLGVQINKEEIVKKFQDNWKQIKGGKKTIGVKKRKGNFEKQLQQCHKASSVYMKNWHKSMKKTNPEAYYLSQYEKFKKIGGYKFTTKKGEKVRNKLEKDTADSLFDKNIDYVYEPLIKIDKHYFFPDFLINKKVIIECTAWRGYDKAIKLKKKIKYLKSEYKVYILIPKALNNYYKILNKHLIYDLDEMSS